MLAVGYEGVVTACTRVCIEVHIIELGGVGSRPNSVFCVLDVHDIGCRKDLATLQYFLAFLDLHVRAFKTEVLTTLLESVVGQNTIQQDVKKVVEPPVPLAVEELALEDTMPSKRGK